MGRDALGRFVAGEPSALTAEQKAKIAVSASMSWKNRPDYIGDIKDECPKIHGCWRGIRFTKKGKLAGCSKEWEDFRTFYNDVRPTYKKGLVLRRKDCYAPWGKDNFMWVDSSFVGDIQSHNLIEYGGKKLTLIQWGKELGIPHSLIKTRYYKHRSEWTAEEILFGKKVHRNLKVVKDINDPNVVIRAKASKMISSYKIKDAKNGMALCDIDIDWMIDNILTMPCVYCGDNKRIGCDRIDNSKGHTKDNVVPCCIECNTARNNYFTYDEMRRLGKVIAEIKRERIYGLQ